MGEITPPEAECYLVVRIPTKDPDWLSFNLYGRKERYVQILESHQSLEYAEAALKFYSEQKLKAYIEYTDAIILSTDYIPARDYVYVEGEYLKDLGYYYSRTLQEDPT